MDNRSYIVYIKFLQFNGYGCISNYFKNLNVHWSATRHESFYFMHGISYHNWIYRFVILREKS